MSKVNTVWLVDEQGYPITQTGMSDSQFAEHGYKEHIVLTPQPTGLKNPRWDRNARKWKNQLFGR